MHRRVGVTGELRHPDFIMFLNAGGLPQGLVLKLVFRGVEHSLVAPLLDALQESQRDICPLCFGHAILSAVHVGKALAVVDHRIGNGILSDEIRRPVGFFHGFLLRNGSGEKVHAQLDAVFLRFLKVIPGVGVGRNFPLRHSPHTDPHHGKIHPGRGGLRPADSALISRHVDTIGGFVGFLGGALGLLLTAAQKSRDHDGAENKRQKLFCFFHHKRYPFLSWVTLRVSQIGEKVYP